jgi:hypothetical protein
MLPLKRKLLSTTFLPLMVSMGVALAAGSSSNLSAQSQNPCAAKKPVAGKAACNPCAVSAAVPCNPCAAKSAASDRTYTIREGDSLAKVAALTYGDASLYRMLADYNGIADPDLIAVGLRSWCRASWHLLCGSPASQAPVSRRSRRRCGRSRSRKRSSRAARRRQPPHRRGRSRRT